MKKYRIVHINHSRSGDFFTIQHKDFKVKSYSEVKDIQSELRDKFYKDAYSISIIGDAYGKWTTANLNKQL